MSLEPEYTFSYKTIKSYKIFEDYILERLNNPNSFNKRKPTPTEEGYLIDKNYMDYWKKFTNYEDLKININDMDYPNAKKLIKQYRRNNRLKQYQKDACQFSFFSPSSLYNNIQNGGKYVLVDKNFWKLICSDEGLEENGGMRYYLENGKIIFIFGRLGKLEILTYDNILRDGKEMIIRNESGNILKNNLDVNEDYNNEDEDENIDSEIKKLILLYAYEQEMKKKINNLQYRDNNFKLYYLISKDWIEEYKRYYHYDELCKMINSKNDLKNILNKGYNWAKQNITYALSKISTKIPKEPFPSHLKKDNTFLSEGNQVIIEDKYSEVSYWKKFELINEELKNLFANSYIHGYNIKMASSAKGLINEGKIILDLSNDENNEGIYAFEIGVIGNKDMMFKEEYIFQYDNEECKNNHFDIVSNDIYLFQKENLGFNINLKCNLMLDDGEICGIAYKIPSID